MLRVAITGNIASGKSVLEDFLVKSGFEVYDTDKIAHEILSNSNQVKSEFSDYDILTNGQIDRTKLGEIVFNDKEKMKSLEKIIHPQVEKELNKIFSKSEGLVFISVPQLYEAGFEKLFDKVILVTADDNIRLKRLMKRNNLSEEKALIRINSQISQEDKVLLANFVIENNKTIKDMEKKSEKVLDKLKFNN